MPSNYTLLIGLSAIWVLACRGITRFSPGRFQRLLNVWLIAAAVIELTAIGLIMMHHRNVIMYNLWWPTEFSLLVVLGQALHPWNRKWLVGFLVTFGAVWIWDVFSIDPFYRAATRSMIIGELMISAYYLWQFWMIANTWQGRLRDSPGAWLCLAVLVHAGPAGPLLGSYNYFGKIDLDLAHRIFHVNQIFCIAKFILMGVLCFKMNVVSAAVRNGT